MALTKKALAKNLYEVLGMGRDKAEDLVKTFFNEILILLERGYQLKLHGFGNFKLLNKKERIGRNPKTGVEAMITPRRVVSFVAGNKLKCRVDNKMSQKEEKINKRNKKK